MASDIADAPLLEPRHSFRTRQTKFMMNSTQLSCSHFRFECRHNAALPFLIFHVFPMKSSCPAERGDRLVRKVAFRQSGRSALPASEGLERQSISCSGRDDFQHRQEGQRFKQPAMSGETRIMPVRRCHLKWNAVQPRQGPIRLHQRSQIAPHRPGRKTAALRARDEADQPQYEAGPRSF